MESTLFYIHALSSLHVGTGQGTGVIDLPIVREKASYLPIIPGSSLKGVLRDVTQDTIDDIDCYHALFGPDVNNASDFAGAIALGDARLLALPVRSWNGTFAWATCPMVLNRFARDIKAKDVPKNPELAEACDAQYTSNTVLKQAGTQKIYLEDLDLSACEGATEWAQWIAKSVFVGDEASWHPRFAERFVILSDAIFDFLSETGTEVRSRIKVDHQTRTAQNLWYEEYLPAEALFWGVVACDSARKGSDCKLMGAELLNLLPRQKRLQIGGNATVGAGQVHWIMEEGGQDDS